MHIDGFLTYVVQKSHKNLESFLWRAAEGKWRWLTLETTQCFSAYTYVIGGHENQQKISVKITISSRYQ